METPIKLNTASARSLGAQILPLMQAGDVPAAYNLLAPVLAGKTPFRLLDVIGQEIGDCIFKELDPFLEHIAGENTMGGWVVIANALGQHTEHKLSGALTRCRKYVVRSDTWYGTDILGERVPGPALVSVDFEQTLSVLESWRTDRNRWVRRVVGVAVHFWAKRSRGKSGLESRAAQLLSLLEPMFEEQNTDAVKGVGWGLKTLGRHYPNLVSDWLSEQIIQKKRNPRMLMIRKATTYLGDYKF
jgi:hypothetical protein